MFIDAKTCLILSLLLITGLFPLVTTYSGDEVSIVWPTYKYDFAHTGYYDISNIVRHSFKYDDFVVKWKTKADLCVASSPAVGDINGDGILDVVYNSCDGFMYAVRGDNGEILWKFITGGEFADPTIWDIDNDGKLEIISMGSEGILYCVDGYGRNKWNITNRFFRGSPAIADIDGDGYYEVIAGSSDGYVYVIRSNGYILYKLRTGDSLVSTPSIGDIDLDNKPEVVVVEGTYLHIIDFSNNKPIIYKLDLGEDLVGPPTLYDIDDDNILEAIIASRKGTLYAVDLVDGKILHKTKLPAQEISTSPSIGDIDGDGIDDIVVGTMYGLFILTKDFSIKYKYTDLSIYSSSPIIVDIDGDGINEIITGQENGDIDIIDVTQGKEPMTEIQWFYTTGGPIMGTAAVADVDADGLPEILIGSRDYHMYCIDGIPSNQTIIHNTETGTTISQSPTTSTRTTLSTSIRINLTTGTGTYVPRPNIELILGAIIVSLIIIAIVIIKTRQ